MCYNVFTVTGYSVKRNGRVQQGWSTFDNAAELVAQAHRAGENWEVTIRDKNGSRLLTKQEGQRLVKAAVELLTK